MIIFIRGHIRNSFNDKGLYNLIKSIIKFHKTEIKIYIHTWKIMSSSLSWRNVEKNKRIVTKDSIYNYFQDLSRHIKNIIIEDDTKIEIKGKIEGNICSTKCPLLGWKNMWHGIYTGIDYINNNEELNEYVIHTRFDILSNSFSQFFDKIITFIHATRNINNFDKNKFLINLNNNTKHGINQVRGIDNFYIGNVKTMHVLISHFYNNLDDILLKYPNNKCQEYLVYLENNYIFDNTILIKELTI
jgi:hypothetical protein